MKDVLRENLMLEIVDIIYMEMKRFKKHIDTSQALIQIKAESDEYQYNEELNMCRGFVKFSCEIFETNEEKTAEEEDTDVTKYGEVNLTYNVGLKFSSKVDVSTCEDRIISQLIVDIAESQAHGFFNDCFRKMELPEADFSSFKRG